VNVPAAAAPTAATTAHGQSGCPGFFSKNSRPTAVANSTAFTVTVTAPLVSAE